MSASISSDNRCAGGLGESSGLVLSVCSGSENRSTVFHSWLWNFHKSKHFHATNLAPRTAGGYSSNTRKRSRSERFRGFPSGLHTDEVTGSNPVSPTLPQTCQPKQIRLPPGVLECGSKRRVS